MKLSKVVPNAFIRFILFCDAFKQCNRSLLVTDRKKAECQFLAKGLVIRPKIFELCENIYSGLDISMQYKQVAVLVQQIKVIGKSAGHIGYKPFRRDVTNLLRPGTNTVEVIVTGTLKNTLGPHHAGTGVGSAWPSMFHRGPENGPPAGNKYHTIDYGLFEPFLLKQITIK